MMEFYDRSGAPLCFSPDSTHLYFWDGRPAAYVIGNVVFSFAGRPIGWFDRGWLYDLQGRPALFTETAPGGPQKPPSRQVIGPPGQPGQLPMKAMRAQAPQRPMLGRDWSPVSGAGYFSQ